MLQRGVINARLAKRKQGKLWHGPGAPIPFCCHLDTQPQCVGQDKRRILPCPTASWLGFTSGAEVAAAKASGPLKAVLGHLCTSVKVTKILTYAKWGITGHSGAPVPGPQDYEGWKQSAGGPPFGTETTYWLNFGLTTVAFNLTGLTLVLRPLTAGLDDREVPLSALSTLNTA